MEKTLTLITNSKATRKNHEKRGKKVKISMPKAGLECEPTKMTLVFLLIFVPVSSAFSLAIDAKCFLHLFSKKVTKKLTATRQESLSWGLLHH